MSEAVVCEQCGSPNTGGWKFCGECGARLVIEEERAPLEACPRCGWHNDNRKKFCVQCGQTLVATDQLISQELDMDMSEVPRGPTVRPNPGAEAPTVILPRSPAARAPGEPPAGMVLVAGGEFLMGSDKHENESPAHRVYVPPFFIDVFPVTNSQFREFDPAHRFAKGREDHPVAHVDWFAANEYAIWIGKRLPSEAEWEKAARGTDGREYPWGDEFSTDCCNVQDTKIGNTTPVGAFAKGASPCGCHDMAGNVEEWTSDWYRPYAGSTAPEATFPDHEKVIRGGSYYGYPRYARCANRMHHPPTMKNYPTGFRCVKGVDAEE